MDKAIMSWAPVEVVPYFASDEVPGVSLILKASPAEFEVVLTLDELKAMIRTVEDYLK